jgi:hypothetical protein
MEYHSAEQYKAAHKNRETWSKTNDYEVYNYAVCLHCKYFKLYSAHCTHGNCGLMEQEGAYNGVMALAVCNRFLSTHGTDINGKVVIPSLLPKWNKTRKDKAGNIFVVNQ